MRAKAPSWLRLDDGPSEGLVREGWVRLREGGRLNLLVRVERLAKVWSKLSQRNHSQFSQLVPIQQLLEVFPNGLKPA